MNLSVTRYDDRFVISIDLEDFSVTPYLSTSVRHLMSWREAGDLHSQLGAMLLDWDIENGGWPDRHEEDRIDQLTEQDHAMSNVEEPF